MGSMRLVWALSAGAPWCMALGLIVSFTAEAGQEVPIGASRAAIERVAMPDDLVPSWQTRAFSVEPDGFGGLVGPASLIIGSPEELEALPNEDDPHAVMKRGSGAFPAIDRSHKGNPDIGLRPSFETRLRGPTDLDDLKRFQRLYAGRGSDTPPATFFPADDDAVGPATVVGFEGGVDTAATTGPAVSLASPAAAAAGQTLSASGPANPRPTDGSSPAVPRAVGLGSTTPALSDSLPMEVDAMLRLPGQAPGAKGRPGAPNVSIVARDGQLFEQPDYLSLISAENFKREQQCLAEAIYFEARSESEAGQAAVAQVVLNRVASGLYPTTVCAVVYQNARRYLGCQFSFACEGKSLRITEPGPWTVAQRIAREVTEGQTYMERVGGATHYHAKYVSPPWARQLMKMDVIGQHIFYKLKPGQT
ncbi:MAG: cell wall hydrolase [Methylobacteriaceae bacterium]|nr:cell wall hydrolase [Methylobacteriaceae bacterium]MBV9244963.1 cell wall hydrolase [Methylobacteriaceae bacterium]